MLFGKVLGILGGGQLAKMMSTSASKLGISTIIFTNEIEPCAKEHSKEVINSSFLNDAKLLEFAQKCDFITIETENIPINAIQLIEKHFPDKISASSQFISIAQNRINEKQFAQELKVPVGKYCNVKTKEDILNFFNENGTCILKTTTQGYDGKGQKLISSIEVIDDLNFNNYEFILEQKINFVCELSVVITKDEKTSVIFPIPRNIHQSGILRRSIVPFAFETFDGKKIKKIQDLAKKYTKKIAESINYKGTFAVEFFVLQDGSLLFNELAPRPHNSGHFTNDLCNISQFENHIRAVCNIPLIEPKLLHKGAMFNIIGNDIYDIEKFLDKPNYKIHLYNKDGIFDGRKMGHYNIIS